MASNSVVRELVSQALLIKRLTPEIENMINDEIAKQGHINDFDYEALEYLMKVVNQGKIHQVKQ